MHKLVLFIMMVVFYMTIFALQIDEELAMNTLFRAKHSLNRSVHAAAQQLDGEKLARGIYSIHAQEAQTQALFYLQQNLALDAFNVPLAGSFLRSKVEVLLFEVINEEQFFPFIYTNPTYNYTVTLQRPGVIMIIQVVYPRIYNVVGPITWEIKGTSELVY